MNSGDARTAKMKLTFVGWEWRWRWWAGGGYNTAERRMLMRMGMTSRMRMWGCMKLMKMWGWWGSGGWIEPLTNPYNEPPKKNWFNHLKTPPFLWRNQLLGQPRPPIMSAKAEKTPAGTSQLWWWRDHDLLLFIIIFDLLHTSVLNEPHQIKF